MKGLLIKDFELMKNQRNFFLMILVVGAIMLMSGTDKTFAIAYITMICTLFVVSTISYDEYENGAAFLFTLPITRKLYVTEKYVFGLSLAGLSWIIVSTIAFVMDNNKGLIESAGEWWAASAMLFAMGIFAVEIMLPVHIKFGAERSRIALLFIFGIVALVVAGVEKACNAIGIDITPFVGKLQNISLLNILFLIIAAIAVGLVISFSVSKSLMEKKEY